jgi:hypothetical protein
VPNPTQLKNNKTDLPWGERELTRRACARLYPRLLREVARVLRPDGRALLLTKELKLVRTALTTTRDHPLELDGEPRPLVIGFAVWAFKFRRRRPLGQSQ